MNTKASTRLWDDRFERLQTERTRRRVRYEAAIARARDQWQIDLEELSHKEDALFDMIGDEVVLVRMSIGDPLRCYHYAASPCGRAAFRRFTKKLEGECMSDGLIRCTRCRWPKARSAAA